MLVRGTLLVIIMMVYPITAPFGQPPQPDPSDISFDAPAFCDLQVNGFTGVDFNDPRVGPPEYGQAVEMLWKTGVTRFFPTVITGAAEAMCSCLEAAARAAETPVIGPSIAGIHLEGPWISAADGPRGAHPKKHVRPPDRHEFRRFQQAAGGRIRLVTMAPEWDGAPSFITWLVEQGIYVSIGHTGATAAQIADAVRAGARLSTHLGNGCGEHQHRHHN